MSTSATIWSVSIIGGHVVGTVAGSVDAVAGGVTKFKAGTDATGRDVRTDRTGGSAGTSSARAAGARPG
jgi:hypothetical protein